MAPIGKDILKYEAGVNPLVNGKNEAFKQLDKMRDIEVYIDF